jgi:tetratricopeptide (TPR) repeat protein
VDAMKHFSARDAARILQATEAQIRNWSRMGAIGRAPAGETRHELTFQELVLLRTTKGLLESGVPPHRVRRIWSSLRRQLTDDLPLTSIRILADGDRAVAWDGNAMWQPDSGQFLLDFSLEEIADPGLPEVALKVQSIPSPAPAHAPEEPGLTAEQWFHIGCELENASPLEARQAYLQALEADPSFTGAHLNLGRLDHEAGELGKAEAHYRAAAQSAPDDTLCHFNLAVLLEDRGRPDEAIQAYEQAIARDPDAADAHHNLGLLLDSRGRRTDAMRHLMIARRLYAHAGREQ